MKTPLCFRWSLRLLMLVTMSLCLLPGAARALNDISQYKLFGHWTSPTPINYYFGHNAKVNETWAVVASPYCSEPATYVGSVQVFSAATGGWVRKLVSPISTAFTYFGQSVAISGDLAVIGARGGRAGLGRPTSTI